MNPLTIYGTLYNTDKVTHHEYDQIYDKFISPFYNDEGIMIEIGIDRGASLKMWLDVFKKAFIYGLDINHFSEGGRYKILQIDQSKSDQLDLVTQELKNKRVFFINDDGSHIPEHQLLTFNKLFPLLIEGGVYIIEDVEVSYWKRGTIYGYPSEYGYKHPKSITEIFKNAIDIVNREFCGETACHIDSDLQMSIDQVTFARNCIIITKRTNKPREYRFAKRII